MCLDPLKSSRIHPQWSRPDRMGSQPVPIANSVASSRYGGTSILAMVRLSVSLTPSLSFGDFAALARISRLDSGIACQGQVCTELSGLRNWGNGSLQRVRHSLPFMLAGARLCRVLGPRGPPFRNQENRHGTLDVGKFLCDLFPIGWWTLVVV